MSPRPAEDSPKHEPLVSAASYSSEKRTSGKQPFGDETDRNIERRFEDFGDRLPRLDIDSRIQRAAESILDNEALTADLDDSSAKVITEWGVACARTVAQDTAGLDDTQAEDVMASRMRATRQLIRSVTRLVAEKEHMDEAIRSALIEKIVENASTVYGERLTSLNSTKLEALVREQGMPGSDSVKLIENLRRLIEKPNDSPGGMHAV